jgi:acetyltransferase-like isoleucine patch superfamily enzyme
VGELVQLVRKRRRNVIRWGVHSSVIIDIQGEFTIPATTVLEPGCILYGGKRSVFRFGEENTVYPSCVFRLDRGSIVTGKRVSFGPGCLIYETRAGLRIGDCTLIAAGVAICGVNHGFADLDLPMRDQKTEELPIEIGADVWIGMGAIILPGAKIGDGCVIGAGSVVRGTVEPYTVGYGVPLRPRKSRRLDRGGVGLPALPGLIPLAAAMREQPARKEQEAGFPAGVTCAG